MTLKELRFEIERLEALGRTMEAYTLMWNYVSTDVHDREEIDHLIREARQEGYDEGYEQGREEGYEEGFARASDCDQTC